MTCQYPTCEAPPITTTTTTVGTPREFPVTGSDDTVYAAGLGVVLVVVALIALAFTRRYPRLRP